MDKVVIRDGAPVTLRPGDPDYPQDAPPPPPPPVPEQVPLWAAQAAFKQWSDAHAPGKFEVVDTTILGMKGSNPPVFFAWTMGNFASRRSALVGTLAGGFGMADADVDAVFVAADAVAQAAG